MALVSKKGAESERPPFGTTFRWYLALWKPHKGVLVRLMLLTVISAGLRVALPTLFAPVLESAQENAGSVPWSIALGIVAVGVLRSVVYGLLQYTRASMNFALGREARERTFDLLTELGPDVYVKHPAGDLLTRLTDDCGEEKMSWFACSGVFRLVEAAIVVAFALAVMATISPALTLVACAPLPLIAIFYLRLAGRLDVLFDTVQKRVSSLESFLDALFTGIRAVKANGLERSQAEHFSGLVARHRDAGIAAETAHVSVEMLYGYGWQLVLPTLVYFGGRQVMHEQLTLPAFVSFYGLTLLLVWPMLDLGSFIVRFRQSGASVARLLEIEKNAPEVSSREGAPARALEHAVSFESVTRRSEDGKRTLLEDVSFPVPVGGTTAIVGEVGSGKSTVLRLLPRIMDPRPGKVALDGTDLRDVDLGAWRRGIGYVPQ
ncbi:ABC transporter ATP-binding protein, partial [bacterium]|nr:ABC transporter ATP-binding protein [bacterium]